MGNSLTCESCQTQFTLEYRIELSKKKVISLSVILSVLICLRTGRARISEDHYMTPVDCKAGGETQLLSV